MKGIGKSLDAEGNRSTNTGHVVNTVRPDAAGKNEAGRQHIPCGLWIPGLGTGDLSAQTLRRQ